MPLPVPSAILKLFANPAGKGLLNIRDALAGLSRREPAGLFANIVSKVMLNPEQRRALTLVNSSPMQAVMDMPSEISQAASGARDKLKLLLDASSANRVMPDASLLSAAGITNPMAGGLGKAMKDPLEYVYQVKRLLDDPKVNPERLKYTVQEQLALLEAGKQLAGGRSVIAPSAVRPLVRGGAEFFGGKKTINPVLSAERNPEIVSAGQSIANKLLEMGISPDTIMRTQFSNVTSTNPYLKPALIGLAGAGTIGGMGMMDAILSRYRHGIGSNANPGVYQPPIDIRVADLLNSSAQAEPRQLEYNPRDGAA